MKPVRYIADHIRRVLKDGGSAPHAAEVQWFFKEEIKSRGWYTNELRKLAKRFRRSLLSECGLDYMVQVADDLFHGDVLEEKVFAVFMLQDSVAGMGEREFRILEGWLPRVSSWADHDALASFLLGPMIAAEPKRLRKAKTWAKSKDRWHRRAACVSLIRGLRSGMFLDDAATLSDSLLEDKDDMVQKGLGWMLREMAKYNRDDAVPYLMRIRERAPRLVLRTACETLPPELKAEILQKGPAKTSRKSKAASRT